MEDGLPLTGMIVETVNTSKLPSAYAGLAAKKICTVKQANCIICGNCGLVSPLLIVDAKRHRRTGFISKMQEVHPNND